MNPNNPRLTDKDLEDIRRWYPPEYNPTVGRLLTEIDAQRKELAAASASDGPTGEDRSFGFRRERTIEEMLRGMGK